MVLNRRRGGNLGLLLLGTQIMNFGLQHIPPVTLSLLAGQVAVFLNVFPKHFPSAHSVCMSSYLVLEHRDWRRLLLANFFHADDMHLYFNMVSLLYKGSMLERKFGNVYFAFLVAIFTGLTSLTYVGLGFVLDTVLSDQSYYLSCAVGFSGVLFALKVLTTEYSPDGTRHALGFIPVPSKYIFWAELVLIQLVTPNASFVGHLAGILVGLMYTKGPLKPLIDSFMEPGALADFSQANRSGRRPQSSFFSFGRRFFTPSSSSTTGHRPPRPRASENDGSNNSNWPGPGAPRDNTVDSHYNEDGTYQDYTGGLTEEQQYQRALEESMSQVTHPHRSTHQPTQQPTQQPTHQARSTQSSGRLYPDLDELRNRRTNFYQ